MRPNTVYGASEAACLLQLLWANRCKVAMPVKTPACNGEGRYGSTTLPASWSVTAHLSDPLLFILIQVAACI